MGVKDEKAAGLDTESAMLGRVSAQPSDEQAAVASLWRALITRLQRRKDLAAT